MSKERKAGYGKPPKSGRFKKGMSGNPKGRPKGSKSLKTIVLKELSEKLDIKLKGKAKKVSKLEALIKKLMKDALEGNAKAQAEILKLAGLYTIDAGATEAAVQPTAAEDQLLIDAFVARMQKKAKGGGDE